MIEAFLIPSISDFVFRITISSLKFLFFKRLHSTGKHQKAFNDMAIVKIAELCLVAAHQLS